jgi:hypothetical protein
MRKMKKFLAVALSAAMVLSVSVPAMAAEEGTSVAASASVEAAKAKEKEAQDAFDKANDDLQDAVEKLAQLEAIQNWNDIVAPSKAKIAQDEETLLRERNNRTAYQNAVNEAQIAIGNAETDLVNAKANYDSAVAAYDSAKQLYDAAVARQAELDASPTASETEKEMAARDVGIYENQLVQAINKVASKRFIYDGTEMDEPDSESIADLVKVADKLIKAEENFGGAVKAVSDRKNDLAAAQKAVEGQDEVIRQALAVVSIDRALVDAAKDGKDAVKKAREDVKAKQHALNEALDVLNAAKADTRAAVAKEDEGRKRLASETYEKAKLNEKMAAEDEAAALDALNKAKADLQKIRDEIQKNLDYITAYDEAVAAEKAAQDEAAKAAVLYADKRAEVAVLTEVAKQAADDAANVDFVIAALQRELDLAKADPNYKLSPSLQEYIAKENKVAELEAALKKVKENLPTTATTVVENANAMLAKATDEMNAAKDDWNAKELKAAAAVDTLIVATKNFKEAVKKLYVVDANGNPVDAKNNPLCRVGGQWVYMGADGEPLTEKGNVVTGTPKKLVTYKQVEVIDYVEETEVDDYVVLTDEFGNPVYTELLDAEGNPVEGQYVPVYVTAGTHTEYTPYYVTVEGNKNNGAKPISLYAKEEVAEGVVAAKQKIYDAKVKAHADAKEDLAKAAAEYEYYYGKKPSDDPQPTPKPIPTQFTDVKATDWFAPYVGSIVEKGIMNGMSKTFFGAYSPLQRQDFAVILWRMAGEPKSNYPYSFVDVDAKDYYADAVAWAASMGIVKGYADTGFTVFGVGDDITREDFCVMLYRFCGYPEPTGTLDGFADANKVSGYAEKAVKWAVENGAITGKTGANGEKLIDPQAKIARAEAAKIIDIITDNN